jgi:hypothetical protein
MTFDKAFNKQSRLVQLILLLIPGVNWITELLVRWSVALRKKDLIHVLVAVLVTFTGFAFGWLDFLWILLFNHIVLAK